MSTYKLKPYKWFDDLKRGIDNNSTPLNHYYKIVVWPTTIISEANGYVVCDMQLTIGPDRHYVNYKNVGIPAEWFCRNFTYITFDTIISIENLKSEYVVLDSKLIWKIDMYVSYLRQNNLTYKGYMLEETQTTKIIDGLDETVKLYDELKSIYKAKNSDYGNSFGTSLDKYGTIAALSRISDKFNRFETLILNGEDSAKVNESVEDTLLDLANYAIMTVGYFREKREDKEE